MTLSSLLSHVKLTLEDSGVASPEVDAEMLISHVLGLSRAGLYLEPTKLIAPEREARIMELTGRRAERVPLQLVLGECEFMSLTFRTRRGVFIPRPETEVLVDAVIEKARRIGRAGTVLDVGTGCGVIAVSLAKMLKPDLVVACDICGIAVEIASENAILNRVDDTVRFVVGDGAGFLREVCRRQGASGAEIDGRMRQGGWGGFDVVVCNPPYVATAEIAGLEPEVRDHDPAAALDGGSCGTEFIDGIVPQLTSIVRDGGIVALEIGSTQAEAVCSIFRESGLRSVETLRDLAGLDRVIIGRVV